MNGELPAAGVDLPGWRGLVMDRAGIGKACARRLIRAGAEVIVLDLDREERVADEIGGHAIQADLAQPEWSRSHQRGHRLRQAAERESAAHPADKAWPAKCLMLVSRLQVLGTCRGSTSA